MKHLQCDGADGAGMVLCIGYRGPERGSPVAAEAAPLQISARVDISPSGRLMPRPTGANPEQIKIAIDSGRN